MNNEKEGSCIFIILNKSCSAGTGRITWNELTVFLGNVTVKKVNSDDFISAKLSGLHYATLREPKRVLIKKSKFPIWLLCWNFSQTDTDDGSGVAQMYRNFKNAW